MKNVFKKGKIFFIVLSAITISDSFSQTRISWNPAISLTSLTGTFPTGNITNPFGTVTAAPTGVGAPNFQIQSPAPWAGTFPSAGNTTMASTGTYSDVPSQSLTFNFSIPVIITRFDMDDIDLDPFSWDDSFDFAGTLFTNNPAPISSNCNVTLTAATATGDYMDGESASWFCSNSLTSFSLNYRTTNGVTCAYLGYSIEVLVPPAIDQPICQNEPPPQFPTVGNGIQGTWSPQVINTSVIGISEYIFTPDANQPIQCPIAMSVSVVDCCPSNLTSSVTISTMAHQERMNWISSSDTVTFGDGILGNGVVYHAGDYIELTTGFESVFGSQFSAYPLACSGTFNYRNSNSAFTETPKKYENTKLSKAKVFLILNDYPGEYITIRIMNVKVSKLNIYSIDGKNVIEQALDNKNEYKINVKTLSKGIYIASVTDISGNVSSQKFIKN